MITSHDHHVRYIQYTTLRHRANVFHFRHPRYTPPRFHISTPEPKKKKDSLKDASITHTYMVSSKWEATRMTKIISQLSSLHAIHFGIGRREDDEEHATVRLSLRTLRYAMSCYRANALHSCCSGHIPPQKDIKKQKKKKKLFKNRKPTEKKSPVFFFPGFQGVEQYSIPIPPQR